MIVVDASVVVDHLVGGPSPAGDALAAAFADHEHSWSSSQHCPCAGRNTGA